MMQMAFRCPADDRLMPLTGVDDDVPDPERWCIHFRQLRSERRWISVDLRVMMRGKDDVRSRDVSENRREIKQQG